MLKAISALIFSVVFFTASVFAETSKTNVTFIGVQDKTSVMASNLIGEYVKNNKGETVGHINDLVFDKDQNLKVAVIGVGGFLGLGEKDVAVSFDTLEITSTENDDFVITANLTKDVLQAAPKYKRINAKDGGVVKKVSENMSELGKQARDAADYTAKKTKEAYESAKETVAPKEEKTQ